MSLQKKPEDIVKEYRDELQEFVKIKWGEDTIIIQQPPPDIAEKDTPTMFASVAKLINDIRRKITLDVSSTGDRLRKAYIPILNAPKGDWENRKVKNLSDEENIVGIFSTYWPAFSIVDFHYDDASVPVKPIPVTDDNTSEKPDLVCRVYAKTFWPTTQRYSSRPHTELSWVYCKAYNDALISGDKALANRFELLLRVVIIHELGHALYDRRLLTNPVSEGMRSPRELNVKTILYEEENTYVLDLDYLLYEDKQGESGRAVEHFLYGGFIQMPLRPADGTDAPNTPIPQLYIRKFIKKYKEGDFESIDEKTFELSDEEIKRQLEDNEGVPFDIVVNDSDK